MNVYKYDEITNEYVGTETAQLNPLETEIQGKDVWLLPANATFDMPLVVKEGYAQVFKDNVWNYVEDNRGKEYWLADDEYGTPARVMKELGEFPEGAVFEAPEKPFEQLKSEKIAEFKSTRDNLEVEPITYNGNSFDYDEKARDRINAAIIALDLAGADAQLSWTTADNNEAIVTANDLRGIIASVALRSNELHVKYRELKALVEATTTKEELEVIVW